MRKVTAVRGWNNGAHRYAVLDWSEDESTSWVVSSHSKWDRALEAAFEYAQANGRYFQTAEVVPLRPHKETLF